jgi:hypothetical protein
VLLYQQRFETAPRRGAIVQTVTGNLVEVSSAELIEIFNGVNNRKECLVILFFYRKFALFFFLVAVITCKSKLFN